MADLLIVEDEKDIADVVCDVLSRLGHAVEPAADGAQAEQILAKHDFDLLILDWMLPQVSGVDLCKKYRREGGQAHVLMLTAREEIDDKALALDLGADDYLCKPFHLKELMARVTALLRRPTLLLKETLEFAGWKFDAKSGVLTRGTSTIKLVPREAELLAFLLRYPGSFFSAETLLERVWPASSFAMPETVRTHIKNIRKKLSHSDFGGCIEHVRGRGYRVQQ